MSDSSESIDSGKVIRDRFPHSRLKSGGGGGTYDEMEARVAKLEELANDTRVTLARMEERMNGLATKEDVSAIEKHVSAVEARVGAMPTTWQMIGVFAAMIGLLLGGSGMILAIIRYVESGGAPS